jgi:hypothetical protein
VLVLSRPAKQREFPALSEINAAEGGSQHRYDDAVLIADGGSDPFANLRPACAL